MRTHASRTIRGIVRLAGLVLLACAVTGGSCGSRDAAKRIAAFSTATILTTENTAAAFDIVERKYYDAMVARAVVNYTPTSGFDPTKIVPFLSSEEAGARAKVLKAVQTYAEKLAAILGNEQLQEFDKQTIALGKSLVSLDETLAARNYLRKDAVTPAEIAIFTTAVNALGRWFIEYKREKGARRAIDEMDGNIQKIAELLAKDLGSSPADGSGARGLRGQLWNQYALAMVEQTAFIDKGMTGTPPLDPISRRAEIKTLIALAAEQRQADATLKSMQGALKQLKETHGKLKDAFSENAFELESAISSLISEGRRVKDFYEKLDKK